MTLVTDKRVLLISLAAFSGCAPASVSEPAAARRDALVTTRFSTLSPLSTPRSLAGAALLNDGRVIVVGGRNGAELASTEVFNPLTGEWKAGPSLLVPRARFVLRNQLDFDLTVLGGELAGAPLSNVEVLGNFSSQFVDAGLLQEARADFVASELERGQLQLVGGGLDTCERFDPAAGTSATCASFGARVGANAEVALEGGDVFLPVTGAWLRRPADGGAADQLGVEPALTTDFTASLLPSGEVVTVGGAPSSPRSFVYAPDDGGVFALPDLAAGRHDHRATVLPSDELFVFGGEGDGGALSSGELLLGGRWSPVSSMTARSNHVQLLLPEGAVLLAGGEAGGAALASVELFESLNPTVTRVTTPARSGACGVVLGDGRYLRVGGMTAAADVFDPASGTWAPVAAPASARAGCTASLLNDGRVLVVGGEAGGVALASAEVFDAEAGAWTPAGPLGTARAGHSAAVLPNGRVLVAGGFSSAGGALASAELYDVGANAFLEGGAMATARGSFPLTLLGSGDVLATGGLSSRTGARLTGVDEFEWDTGTWSVGTPMPVARARHTATAMSDGTVVVLGGEGAARATAASLDTSSDQWTSLAASASPREDHVAFRLPYNRLLVAGGAGAGATSLERIDLSLQAPDVSLAIPPLVQASGAVLADGRALLVGRDVAALFDEGRQASSSPAPGLGRRGPLRSPSPPAISGSGFHPVMTSSDGTTLSSPTNQPIVRFTHLATGHVRFAETEYFDDTSAMLNVPSGWLPGHYAVQVSVAGRLSNPQTTFIGRACSSTSDCGGGSCSSDNVCCATPCATGDCLSGRCSVMPVDGGVEPDGGSEDGGVEVDGGLELDAGVESDGGVTEPPMPRSFRVGCAGAPGVPDVLVLVLAALLRRRR